ncbi:MAG: flavin reductase family protein [Candidatus Bathyarchaeia archaeon]
MGKHEPEKVEFELPAFTEATLWKLRHGGVLLSCQGSMRPNAMTIGWGLVGTLWSKPVFLVAVRPTRFTFQLIEDTGCFTVNVPGEGMEEALTFCGTASGRTVDKFKEMKLTPLAGRKVGSPAVAECVIHYECKVIHKDRLTAESLAEEIAAIYPRGGFHTLYVGEIVSTYADRDAADKLAGPS